MEGFGEHSFTNAHIGRSPAEEIPMQNNGHMPLSRRDQ